WWVITDQGAGFTPGCSCAHNPDETQQNINDLNDCGRGLYILHQIFDQVHWNQRGTELRLCKQLKSRTRLPLVR
ncbi:MAG: ATP-binding protein, partial [Leptolyngbyaceae cyanobacterium CRU_2_3]|nr:ATP-binding protein [Leptolyngbyaceae cyanobacterium CRU_2_3]